MSGRSGRTVAKQLFCLSFVSATESRWGREVLEVSGRVRPAFPHSHAVRAHGVRVAAACLAALLAGPVPASAQSLTTDLLNPGRDGFAPRQSGLSRTDPSTTDRSASDRNRDQPQQDADEPPRPQPAPSRIGNIPRYDVPAATGAADDGFDSLGRKRQKPKIPPGTPRQRAPSGRLLDAPAPPPVPPPSPQSQTAVNRAPVAPAILARVPGQPPRRRLRPETDPFGPVGFYLGPFMTTAAVEFSVGYDTNPTRLNVPKGSPFWVVAPELVMKSDWSRHALDIDLRGSYTGYTQTFSGDATTGAVPGVHDADRPDFTGKVSGRVDWTRDTRINTELRLRVSTDNPGSPNLLAGLSKYPIFVSTGATAGIEQDLGRLRLSFSGLIDRTMYQQSKLTDGTTVSNDDRAFNQYGGIARATYELNPGLRPYVEIEADTRVHDERTDRNGYLRDSDGGWIKVGAAFEFTRLLTGEASIGYIKRTYQDPRLPDISGLLASGSLIWTPTGLTTVKLGAATSVDESLLPGVSGVLTRSYTFEIDHDFRRWLTGVYKFSYGTSDYQGGDRSDQYFSTGISVIYKLSRTFHLKAEIRRDWLDSNVTGASSVSNVVMLGVRVQR